jgi:hypothetical protein
MGFNCEALCLDVSCCLRPNTHRLACLCCEVRLKDLALYCRGQAHLCCSVTACSCPPGHGEPPMLGALFVVCYPSIGICMPQSSVMLRI